jgi:hypothetical protein
MGRKKSNKRRIIKEWMILLKEQTRKILKKNLGNTNHKFNKNIQTITEETL